MHSANVQDPAQTRGRFRVPEASLLWVLASISPDYAARLCTGVLSVTDHLRAIDEDVGYSASQLQRLFEGGIVLDGRGIKYRHIREILRLQQTTPRNSNIAR